MTAKRSTAKTRTARKPQRRSPSKTTGRSKAVRGRPMRARRNTRRPQLRVMRQIAGCAIFAASVVAGWLVAPPLLNFATRADPSSHVVMEIAVQGTERLDASVIASATGIERGETRADIDTEAVSARIEAHPWVRSARVLKPPIGPLVVRIEERHPKAVLKNDQQEEWLLVDETGTAYASAKDSDIYSLPHVSSQKSLAMGTVHPLLAQAVAIGRQVERSGLLAGPEAQLQGWYPELRIPSSGDAEGWILAARGRALQAVLGFDDLEGKLGRFANMLRRAPEELKGIGRVDLRFGDQAVVQLEEGASAK